MTVIRIQDAADPRLHDYLNLTDVALRSRHEPSLGIYMAESMEVIRRAVEAGHRPRSFLMADRWLEPMADVLKGTGAGDFGEVPVFIGESELLKSITGFHLHRGAIAAMHRPALATVGETVAGAARVAVLEDIVDHTNVGAIFRSVAGLGADAVLVSPRCADPLYRRSVRVSMGTVFQVPWTRLEPWPQGLHELRAAGFTIVAMDPTPGAVSLDEFALHLPDRIALIFGTEGAGLSPAARQAVDVSVRIPMSSGVDSLNVAASSAVAFWAVRRDRPGRSLAGPGAA